MPLSQHTNLWIDCDSVPLNRVWQTQGDFDEALSIGSLLFSKVFHTHALQTTIRDVETGDQERGSKLSIHFSQTLLQLWSTASLIDHSALTGWSKTHVSSVSAERSWGVARQESPGLKLRVDP